METFYFGDITVTVRAELAQLAVIELGVGPGVVAPPHRHPGIDEVFIGITGSLEVMLDGHPVWLRPNEVITAHGGQAHGFSTGPDAGATAMVMYAPGDFLGYFRDAASAQNAEQFQHVLDRWGVVPA